VHRGRRPPGAEHQSRSPWAREAAGPRVQARGSCGRRHEKQQTAAVGRGHQAAREPPDLESRLSLDGDAVKIAINGFDTVASIGGNIGMSIQNSEVEDNFPASNSFCEVDGLTSGSTAM
jgi:hypothetical protein